MATPAIRQVSDYENAELLKTLKETVAVGTTDAEFKMFVQLWRSSGLDPFKRELWCIVTPESEWTDRKTGQKRKRDRKVNIMTGINGFYEIANEEQEYDGLEHGFVSKSGELLPITYPGNDYVGAWCKVHRKNRKFPQFEVAMLTEYSQAKEGGRGTWDTKQRVMIVKCADALALRKSFPQRLNGLYVEEELERDEQPAIDATPQKALWYYTVAALEESRKAPACEFLDASGALLDPASGLWVSDHEIPKAAELEVPAPLPFADDDLPGGPETPSRAAPKALPQGVANEQVKARIQALKRGGK